MKKRNIITAVSASVIGAGAAGYFLMNDQQKTKLKENLNQFMNKQSNNQNQGMTFEKAGIPDQLDAQDYSDLENTKMVSEGSQFGVHYYNEQHGQNPFQ